MNNFWNAVKRHGICPLFNCFFAPFISEIAGGQRFSLQKLKEWHEVSKEETKARSVIIHGKISTEHFLYNENGVGFFTNFEKAGMASPIHDLAAVSVKNIKFTSKTV